MRDLGYVEGKNLAIEWRFGEGRPELYAALSAELVRLNVDVIVSAGTTTTHAAQNATATIPIVMAIAPDPVGSGFVKSLAHPGGNITGLTTISSELGPKQLEMLSKMLPGLSRVAVLMNPTNPTSATGLKYVQAAAQGARVKVLPVGARNLQELEAAFSTMIKEKVGAVILIQDGLFTQNHRRVAELALKSRLPSISGFREFSESGALMSYGANQNDLCRRAAIYVDKILRGAKPADLPVEQPTKFDLIINIKTAKALGLKVPQSLLISATEFIE
jgi:putative ABC transport system substrate-binding protein